MESGISFVKRNFLFKFVMFVLILIGLSCFRTSALKVGDEVKDYLTFTAIDGDATVKFSWSMVYRALISFSGVISMAAGEERELKDQYLIDSLLKSGYILPVREAGKVMCSIDDGDNWFNYDANKEIYLEKGENVKFKGSGISTRMVFEGFKTSGKNLSISGNLNSLRLDNNLQKFAGLQDSCFHHMFFDCKNLIDASQLILDAEILSPDCYNSMFYGCTSLAKAPDLPATSLATKCYSNMFKGCTSLTNIPELPATQLADFCYDGMFDGCTNLEFSELMTDKYNKEWTIKTDDGKSGYKTMFNGCIVNWLKYAPENSTVTLYQKEKDNLMGSNGLTGSYNNDNKSELLSTTSEKQEASSPQEPSDDIDPKYDSDTKSVSSNQLANSQDYESKSSKSLAASKNYDSVSSSSLTSNQSSYSGSSNAAKSSAIKTGELTANYILLEFFLLMLLSFKRKRFGC